MAKGSNRLSAGHLNKKGPAKLADGNNLWLYITPNHSRRWVFRYRLNGKDYEMGLGGLSDVSMAEARKAAAMYRDLKRQGIDPIHYKKAQLHKNADKSVWTFDRCAEAYIDSHAPAWHPRHTKLWRSTIKQYCSPVFGNLPVAQVNTALVMQVVEPLWRTRTETASRVRGRIENILSWAAVRGYREGQNPAVWRGHIKMLLPPKSKVKPVKHFAAMPYKDVASFVVDLRKHESLVAKALQFTIMTAARSKEVMGASWDEIDMDAAVWTIPAERMKAERVHRVPLSKQAVALLESLPIKQGWLWPSSHHGKHINVMYMLRFLRVVMEVPDFTVHGYRSTFRSWCAEQSNSPREIAEAALAHTLESEVEAAYMRSDLLAKRRQLMQQWSDYLDRVNTKADVVQIGSAS